MSIVSNIFSCCFPPPCPPNPEILVQLKMKNGQYSDRVRFLGESFSKEGSIGFLNQENVDSVAILCITNSYGTVFSHEEGHGVNPISSSLAKAIIQESDREPIQDIFSRAVQRQSVRMSGNVSKSGSWDHLDDFPLQQISDRKS